jgi:hypothetical protein
MHQDALSSFRLNLGRSLHARGVSCVALAYNTARPWTNRGTVSITFDLLCERALYSWFACVLCGQLVELKRPRVLVTDYPLNFAYQVLPILEEVVSLLDIHKHIYICIYID